MKHLILEAYLWHVMTLNPENAGITVPKQTRMPVRRARNRGDAGPGISP